MYQFNQSITQAHIYAYTPHAPLSLRVVAVDKDLAVVTRIQRQEGAQLGKALALEQPGVQLLYRHGCVSKHYVSVVVELCLAPVERLHSAQ